MSKSPRVLAAKILTSVINNRSSLTATLNEILPVNQDRGFIQELCYGVLRWYWQLTAITKQLLRSPLKAKDTDIQVLLLMGLYQLIHLQTPAHAALNETVQTARDINKTWATKLINGVLRQFLRDQPEILKKLIHDPSAHYSHPQWLLQLIKSDWPQYWENILNANNQRPPMTLRVNRLQVTSDEYLKLLQVNEIAGELIPIAKSAILLKNPVNVKELPGFEDGQVSVQDAAAQLAAELLVLQPGQKVLDACAAPGGKAAHILETEPQLQELVAIDNDEKRLAKVTETLKRLRFSTPVKLICADVAQPNNWHTDQLFDRILLDAPCSATGVIRRHPDIKFLRRAEDIAVLAKTQFKLLTALWSVLKPGGILVYATCSILPAENTKVLQQFLAAHSGATEIKIVADWGVPQAIGRQIFPGENNMDGFYYARLGKVVTL